MIFFGSLVTAILGKYNLGLSYDEIFKLILKYDLKNLSRFHYPEFIKNFVLNLGGQDNVGGRMSRLMEGRPGSRMDSGRLSRQKITPSRLSTPGVWMPLIVVIIWNWMLFSQSFLVLYFIFSFLIAL